jgi:large subunit ribosomal protein L25
MADTTDNASRGEVASLTLSPREITGKKVAVLRREGLIPVHLYGGTGGSLSLQTTYAELRQLLPKVGRNVPVTVRVEGSDAEDICFVREVQRHPVTDALVHVDFLRTDISRKVIAEVPVVLEGVPPAVTLQAGTLIQNMLTLSIEALPLDMPASLNVDVTFLEDFDTTIHVSDIVVGEGVTVMSAGDSLVARVAPPRVEVEEVTGAEEGEEGAEGEDAEGGEGESAESADSGSDGQR